MTAPVEIQARGVLLITTGPSRWVAPVAAQIGVAPDVVRCVLVRLRTGGSTEDDGAFPQAFARTPNGDWLAEQNEQLEQPR